MKVLLLLFVIIMFVLSIPTGIWVFRSAMKANAFNHATGKHVTTWDAMWIELRVQEPSK